MGDSKRDEFTRLYTRLSGSGLTAEAVKASIISLMGISDARYRAYRSETAPVLAANPLQSVDIPAPYPRPFPEALRAPDANALIISDPHAPYHNRALYAVALAVAGALGIRRTCFTGDLFNLDGINRHPKTGPDTNPEVDILIGGGILLAASAVMDELYVMKGNHDANMAKRLDKKFPLRMLVSAALNGRRPGCRVFVTDRDWIHLGETWDVGHLSQYARYPGKKAASIAERRQRNVAVAHDHIQGFMSTSDGKYMGVSTGSMLLKNRFWYKEEALNDYPDWTNGFLIVKDGMPLLFNETGASPLNGARPWGYWEAELGIEIGRVFERYAEDEGQEKYFNTEPEEALTTTYGEMSGTYEL